VLILAHRGVWRRPDERNTLEAFREAFRLGFGLQTDIRDRQGELIVAADPPTGGWQPRFTDLLALYEVMGAPGPLAIAVRADGLHGRIKEALAESPVGQVFAYDMSSPEALGYLRAGLPTFTRQSEYEIEPVFYDLAAGVWLDSFNRDWIDAALVDGHLAQGKRLAIASPELRGRDHRPAWSALARIDHAQVMLCTEYPAEAQVFFNEGRASA
jgi:hypothetical protein